MWVPRSWGDLELALGVQVEGQTLDFKSALPPGQKIRDLAKDAAAMSVEGGVMIVGLDEREGVATQVTPIDLGGAIERIQQVIDAHVSPPLGVDIKPLRENDGDQAGVLVIVVSPSWSAPHQFEGRYPARAGSTTRWMSEREVDALYQRRSELRATSHGEVGLAGFRWPPGADVQIKGAVGMLRMHLRPLGRVRHPDEPHMRNALGRAVHEVATSDEPYIAPTFTPKSLDFLRSWDPAGSQGWRAGQFIGSERALAGTGAAGALYAYGRGLSFAVMISLTDGVEEDIEGSDAKTAQEHHWAVETLSLLRIGGYLYSPIPEASLLRVDLDLGGLLDSVSWQASQGLAFSSNAPRVTENLYQAGGIYSAHELADDPRDAARELLDPFMVAILEAGSDIVARIAGPG